LLESSQPQGHRADGRIRPIEKKKTKNKKKKTMTSSGNKPATFQLAAQSLNQLHYCITLLFTEKYN
jgi:hypothetical protein